MNNSKLLRKMKKHVRKFLGKRSELARTVIESPGTWKALDIIYENNPSGFADWFLLTLGGCKDTRERLKIYKKLLKTYALEYNNNGSSNTHINILDLGCGSARGPIEVLNELKGLDLKFKGVDVSKKAIREAIRRSQQYNMDGNVSFSVYNVKQLDSKEPDEYYHIIGTHGLLDYFTKDSGKELLSQINKKLIPNGRAIVTNMKRTNTLTRLMMEFFGEWSVFYKTEEDIEEMLKDTDYKDIEIYNTPRGFHIIGVGKKPEKHIYIIDV